MVEMLTGTAATLIFLTLLLSCASHLRRPARLPYALRRHETVPRPVASPLALAVVVAEGVLGGTGGLATVSAAPLPLRLAAAGAAVLFTGYGLYGWHVLRRGRDRPPVPCGCAGSRTPLSGVIVTRAAALAGAAVLVAAGAEYAASPRGPGFAVTLLAGAAFAALLWQLPAALFDPSATVHRPYGTAHRHGVPREPGQERTAT